MEGSFPLTVTVPLLSLPTFRRFGSVEKAHVSGRCRPGAGRKYRYAEADHRSGGGVGRQVREDDCRR